MSKKNTGQFAEIASKVSALIEKHATAPWAGRLSTYIPFSVNGQKVTLNGLMRVMYPNLLPPSDPANKAASNEAVKAFWAKVCQASGGKLATVRTQIVRTDLATVKPTAQALSQSSAAAILG